MTDAPTTDDVRDVWVDYHLNPVAPRAEGIALVPEYQAAFDAWLETIRADERERNREADGVAAYLAVESALIDLRAKVQKLHEAPYPHIHYGGEPTGWRVALNAVLILLDQYGSNDE